MSIKLKMTLGIIGVAIIATVGIFLASFKKNEATNWQLRQSLKGEISVQKAAGWYNSFGETIHTWPKVMQDEYPVSITFGDGGKATISVLIRYMTPTSDEDCKLFHAQYASPENVKRSMEAWLNNVMKSTAGIMTASTHAVGRKSEYAQLVMDQTSVGLYKKETTTRTTVDPNDPDGKPLTETVTDLRLDDDKNPIIERVSAFKKYGIEILEVTLGKTEYDAQTIKSFQVKKAALLKIEEIKAQTRQEQEKGRQMIQIANTKSATETANGEAELVKIELIAEQNKQTKLIAANAKKLEAEEEAALELIHAKKEKDMAEIEAERKYQVSLLDKKTKLEIAQADREVATIAAQTKVDVAKLDTEKAAEEAKAITLLAQAEADRIKQAGAITETQRVIAEIEAKRDVGIAEAISKVATPSFVMGAGGNGDNGSNMTDNLMNIKLLQATGLLDKVNTKTTK